MNHVVGGGGGGGGIHHSTSTHTLALGYNLKAKSNDMNCIYRRYWKFAITSYMLGECGIYMGILECFT